MAEIIQHPRARSERVIQTRVRGRLPNAVPTLWKIRSAKRIAKLEQKLEQKLAQRSAAIAPPAVPALPEPKSEH